LCNLYSHTRNVEAIRKLFAKFNDAGANVPPLPGKNTRQLGDHIIKKVRSLTGEGRSA
jgi:hypothetical protein